MLTYGISRLELTNREKKKLEEMEDFKDLKLGKLT